MDKSFPSRGARAGLLRAQANFLAAHRRFNRELRASMSRNELAAVHKEWDDAILEYTASLVEYAKLLKGRVLVDSAKLPDEQRRAA